MTPNDAIQNYPSIRKEEAFKREKEETLEVEKMRDQQKILH
jgi:hypothetical protein